MSKDKFSIRKRVQSFKYASEGLQVLFKEEHNSRVHLIVMITAIGFGVALNVSWLEWCLLVLCFGLVFVLEIVNSAIENLCDLISIEKNEQIKKIKDLAAASVLVSAVTSIIIGLIVFIPKLLNLLS